MINTSSLGYGCLFAPAEFEIDFERVLAVVRLSRCVFSPSFCLGGATVAALKSETAVDGNKKEVADRVASLQARLGSTKLETYAAHASPLWYEYE